MSNNEQLCYLLVLVISVSLSIWGFMELLRKRQPSETTEEQVISRQLRGMGFLLLSTTVLGLGAATCLGLSGKGGKAMKGMWK